MRRTLAACVASAVVLLIGSLIGPAALAQSGGACQLDGTASFSPPLSNTAGNFTYSFGASLTGCQSNVAGAPASGSVQVGKVYTDAVGEQFQEPQATGNGTCATGTTQGTALVFWSDGTRTIATYDTTSAGAAVNQTGAVIGSVTLPAINPAPGQPTSVTLTTTRFAGDQVQGALAFQADPTQCAGSGVGSAGVSGVIGIGTAS